MGRIKKLKKLSTESKKSVIMWADTTKKEVKK
jgi:hypothetical protein